MAAKRCKYATSLVRVSAAELTEGAPQGDPRDMIDQQGNVLKEIQFFY